MNNQKTTSVTKVLLALLCYTSFVAHATENKLIGCWRSQSVEQLSADGKTVNFNSDCVTQYTENEYQSKCHINGEYRVFRGTYRIISNVKMLATSTSLNTNSTSQNSEREVEYLINDEWLVASTNPTKSGDPQGRQVLRNSTLAVKIPNVSTSTSNPDSSACEPRVNFNLRNSKGSKSSLNLTLPSGYKVIYKDQADSPELNNIVRSNFLIGIFTTTEPTESTLAAKITATFGAIIVDESRSGIRPIKEEDFKVAKEKYIQELGSKNLWCESKNIICFERKIIEVSKLRQTRYSTISFVNVKGRIAIIYATASNADLGSIARTKKITTDFAQRLIEDNQ